MTFGVPAKAQPSAQSVGRAVENQRIPFPRRIVAFELHKRTTSNYVT